MSTADTLKYVIKLINKKNAIVLLTVEVENSYFLAPLCCQLTWIVLVTGNLKEKEQASESALN